jgi:hypothetical protein
VSARGQPAIKQPCSTAGDIAKRATLSLPQNGTVRSGSLAQLGNGAGRAASKNGDGRDATAAEMLERRLTSDRLGVSGREDRGLTP